jgi:hypothetical protein
VAQAFILKTIVSIAAGGYAIVVLYVSEDLDDDTTNWKWFWRICFLPLLIVLYASQLYACKILYALGGRCSKATAALLVASKASGEGSKEVQRPGSVASSAARRLSSKLLLDDLENSTDLSVERDSSLRTLTQFNQQNELAEFIGSEDFEWLEIETGLHGRRSLRGRNSRLEQLDDTELLVLDDEDEEEKEKEDVVEKKDVNNEVVDA